MRIKLWLNCKMADFFVDFDKEESVTSKQTATSGIELEDAINILKLLKAVDIRGL